MNWTEEQVRCILKGLQIRCPDIMENVSVDQSLIDISGRKNETMYSSETVCESLDFSEAECIALMTQGGWQA